VNGWRSFLTGAARAAGRGQGLVEAALVLPVLLLLVFAVLAVHRVAQGQFGVSAVARESAATGALADTPAEAYLVATRRGLEVAEGYRLTNGSLRLEIVPPPRGRGGEVVATARYELDFADLPLVSRWARLTISSTHMVPIEPFRSRWGAGEARP
jgi:hypothetical protein